MASIPSFTLEGILVMEGILVVGGLELSTFVVYNSSWLKYSQFSSLQNASDGEKHYVSKQQKYQSCQTFRLCSLSFSKYVEVHAEMGLERGLHACTTPSLPVACWMKDIQS